MPHPLLRKSIADLQVQVLIWGLGVGALLFLTVTLYPSIGSSYAEMINQLPEAWLGFLGSVSALDTIEGYLRLEFFGYAPMALAVFSITAGTGALAGEEGQGTLDMLLAQPITRMHLASVKLVGLLLANGTIMLIVVALFWLGVVLVDVTISPGRAMGAFALLWLFEVTVTFLAMLISLILPSRVLAGSVMAAFLVTSFILESLSHLASPMEGLDPLYFTSYNQAGQALVSDISWGYVGCLIGIGVIAASASLFLFDRRDIGSRSTTRFRLIPRRYRAEVPDSF